VDSLRARWQVSRLAALVLALVLLMSLTRSGTVGAAIDTGWVVHTTRVSVSTAGREGNGSSFGAAVSASGRYVAFSSAASSLVSRDRNERDDVFVHDLRTAVTTRASVSSAGAESDGPSLKPSISADGRVVAFPSSATNLVPGDRNGLQDVFVRDRIRRTTERIVAGERGEPNGPSLAALVSGNGKLVVFSSEASNLVPGDRNGALDVFVTEIAGRRMTRVGVEADERADRSEASSVDASGRVVGFRSFAANLVPDDQNGLADVFVYDRTGMTTERVNVSTDGAEAAGATFRGMVSGSGRFVGFRSRANNLVPGDTNDALDVFVHDRVTTRTTRVSVASDGSQAEPAGLDKWSRYSLFMSRPFLSADGRYAAFTSRASNLVVGDRNGKADIFVHDLWTGRTIIVSVGVDAEQANGDSFVCGISADGRVVAFTSLADNLVPDDTNGRKDVFVAVLRPGRIAPPRR
jgi:Tol biopolymer transport system component